MSREPKRKRLPWEAREDELLSALARDGATVTRIARELQRTPDAVVRRAKLLNVSLLPVAGPLVKRSPSSRRGG
jgi:hypothetical protein